MTSTDEQAGTLRGISQIRGHLRTNPHPVYFVSPTAFNLLGIDRWVRSFFYVNWMDSFDGNHPRVFVPHDRTGYEFNTMEDVCNALVGHPEVRAWSERHGPRPKVCFVMFDKQTERLVEEAGMELILPSCELRRHIDSKIVTTRLANEAGVASVPNVLGRPTSYTELVGLADVHDLGRDLVVQTPYGDSGKTTFFIVGPVMHDLCGHPELTPYRGGWCGNDMFPGALSPAHRSAARRATARLGDRLAQEGYRGFFEVDYLIDRDTGELYLGELNPRISGVTSITNVTAAAYADMPLFAFHLIEYLGVDYEIDVDEINDRWGRVELLDVWSQMVIKDTDDRVELIEGAPSTGIYRLDDDGVIRWSHWGHDWHSIQDESEAFYLRVSGPGEYRYRGGDLGILVSRGRFQADDGTLTERARHWITGMKAKYTGTAIEQAPIAFPAAVKGV